ncbi:4-hydroxybenzoate octaprenyltransferase [Devosia sp. SD17-2]|uniref:4-hydroxybenzoate octaprenyltransferase n=1 Tax=Devosia sp. SD17-2 TaxID=2976459 RepID=UPI0023D7E9B4|nr:4-hydroxybenzoate octaprenyltransferase [Devosia sp. SD17-2]WEJ32541.1 4-hydroxybenzoate octaprenyltransferase [Devosia sp. SD17-2]
MTDIPPQSGTVADAQKGNWLDSYAPDWLKPYGRMARWDRPIGFWLLFWPCAWGIALAAVAFPDQGFGWWHAVLMLIGAILMRGAGCTFNDIVDRDIDMKVARTRSRPIPSGQVTAKQALVFLIIQALLGAVVLFQFNRFTVWAGVFSLVLVAIYPFMKRITWWPQLFLGLAFSYGALVGWTGETGTLGWAPILLYLGTILWVIGYDTIYALQDIEDDALVGVKSTARLFGDIVKPAVATLYVGAFVLWLAAAILAGGGFVYAILSLVGGGVLAWQVWTLDPADPHNPKPRFVINHYVGIAITLALMAEWVW